MATRLVLTVVALVGIVAGLRGGRRELYLYAALLAYVSLASFPFWTEGRFSLPITPLLLIAAVIGLRSLPKGRSSEPQHLLPRST